MICETFEFGTLQDYQFVVVLSFHEGRIVLSRHEERSTWETQGGHIEAGETPLDAARRELYEESGAVDYEIAPLCDYRVTRWENGAAANGAVFTARIDTFGPIPQSEMAEIRHFDTLPEDLTYPEITPKLFARLGTR